MSHHNGQAGPQTGQSEEEGDITQTKTKTTAQKKPGELSTGPTAPPKGRPESQKKSGDEEAGEIRGNGSDLRSGSAGTKDRDGKKNRSEQGGEQAGERLNAGG